MAKQVQARHIQWKVTAMLWQIITGQFIIYQVNRTSELQAEQLESCFKI